MGSAEFVIVSRVIFPVEAVADVSPLYIDVGDTLSADREGSHRLLGRTSVEVEPDRRISLATFFNAFPASYWRRHTSVGVVRLTASLTGSGRIQVYESSARGRESIVASRPFADETVTFDLPLSTSIDGGYLWFDLSSDAQTASTLQWAHWSVPPLARRATGKVTIGIATFNRPQYCLNQLLAIGADQTLSDVLNSVVVVDQGTDLVSTLGNYREAELLLGERLMMVRQPNLGGSGGFSRAMMEALASGADYVLLLDDDAISEPEAVRRSVLFADFASKPTIVGGGMLHLDKRAVMYTRGEVWDSRKAWMAASPGSEYDHNFATNSLRSSPALHKRIDADFNGWWMCLVPTEVVREIGLALPAFIKFDDIEYGLRARDRGFATVCLPGVAVWHMAWHDKEPSRTWEQYFIQRNRWLTSLLHTSAYRGGLLPLLSFAGDVKMLSVLQYSAVRLRHEALRDVLRGPGAIRGMLSTRLSEVREIRSRYEDVAILEDPALLESVRLTAASVPRVGRPSTHASVFMAARVALRHLFLPASKESRRRPQRLVPVRELSWQTFVDIDSALVTAVGGVGWVWYRRDLAMTLAGLARSIGLHAKLVFGWGRLRMRYRGELREITSVRAWEDIIKTSRSGVVGRA